MRFAPSIVLIVAVAGVVAACHPREHSERAAQTGQPGQTEERHGRGGHGIRKICADDIAKFCENADKKKRCLKENLDKLTAACKEAVENGKGHKHDGNGKRSADDDD
jgi:hypothetical protein